MDDEERTSPTRRCVLRRIAASSAVALGGVGTAAAEHGEQGGNREGGNDHGRGKSDERGGEGGQGGGGGRDDTGPSRVTGGSALTFGCSYSGGEIVEITSKGSGTEQYFSGCEAAKEATAPPNKTYEEYNVDGGCNIYIYEKKPVTTSEDLGEPALYRIAEVDPDCGSLDGVDVDKLGLEPAEEGSG
ncbi:MULTISPECIES: hypothetical protein [Salinibaculum]|uniref:hypothetical protein n=1 Tax=Salinibaculum TaxID=2732368 RepID=UPI0030D1A5C3